MIFYGDELGYTNDYSYLQDKGKSYDNRWMYRPVIDWEKNKNIHIEGTVEQRIFSGTQKLLSIRKKITCSCRLQQPYMAYTPQHSCCRAYKINGK
ncbi:MAG: hypothetical protein ABI863_10790 [Ginsengibacter sp.]